MMYHMMSFGVLVTVIAILVTCFIYFIPLIVAGYRKTTNIWLVFIINFFFGWSLVGWIVALFFALSGDSRHTKQCSYCLSNIDEKAKKCAYCGEWVENIAENVNTNTENNMLK